MPSEWARQCAYHWGVEHGTVVSEDDDLAVVFRPAGAGDVSYAIYSRTFRSGFLVSLDQGRETHYYRYFHSLEAAITTLMSTMASAV